ncbi:ABC transporter substrate-binding protein [Bacillus sp. Hm123]|uniref:ABC transporter substrate-binding protein n=1 Tax=Bacillus sp. Hm123 TaxID=3450745 RepID=UPI003F4316B7
MKKIIVLIGMMLLLTACGNSDQTSEAEGKAPASEENNSAVQQETAEFPKTISHIKGETELEKKPERIASVDIMITDYLLLLDEVPIVSEGMMTKEASEIFNKYADGKDITDLGGKVNRETIVEKSPDLILMSSEGRKVETYDEFNKMAPSVVIDFSKDVRSRLLQIAEVVGKTEKAEEVINDLDNKISEAKKVAENHKDEKVLFLVSNGKDFTVMDPKKFSVYYDEIGLVAPEGLPEEENGRVGIEALTALNPDHIFIAENRRKMNTDDKLGLINVWKENPVWKNLKAVKSDQVYVVDTLVGDTFFLGQMAGVEAVIDNLGE